MKSDDTKFFETKEFKKLDAEWKTKLKESGFEDLEEDVKDYKSLRTVTAIRPSNRFFQRETGEAYYDLVREYLYIGVFKKESWKKCWELHGEGLAYREIAKRLNMSHTTVQNAIEVTRRKMLGK